MLRYFSGILLISFLDKVKPGLDFLPKVIATAPCETVSFVDAGERSALSVSSVTESAAIFRTFAVSASFASPYRSTVLMLERDAQDAICQYMNLKIVRPDCEGDDFYSKCVEAIIQTEKKYYIGEHTSIFYEGAKYFHRGLTRYNDNELPVNLFDLENRFTDLLREYKENPDKCSDPILQFASEFNFYSAEEPIACEISAVIVKWLAEWSAPDNLDYDNFWVPGEYSYESIDTMEDLFLCALFCVYVYLIMPNKMRSGDDKT